MFQNKKQFKEINRKLFHIMITIAYPIFYNILPENTTTVLAGTIVILIFIIETGRLLFDKLNNILLTLFEGIYREKERNTYSGFFWTMLGGFFTIFLFEEDKIVTTALLYMCFGDSIAGITGSYFGKIKIIKEKTLEGAFSCFIACFLCGIFFLPWQMAVSGALIVTVIEILPLPMDDNFWIPVISGLLLNEIGKLFNLL